MLSLSDRLKPWEVIAQRLTAAAAADLVIAIYNPASQVPHLAGRPPPATCCSNTVRPSTPVVIGRDVGGAE